MLTRAWGSRHITMSSFLKTSLSKAKILRYFDFPNGYRRHLGFLKSRNFIVDWGAEGRDASACQISSKSINRLRRYQEFSIFQYGGWHHLGLSNSQHFIGWRCPEDPDASLYRFSLKSVVPLRRYCDFSNFQDGRRHYLGFLKSQNFYWLLGPRGSRCISVPNFVKIGESVANILRFYDFSRWRPSAILDLCGVYLDHP